MTWLRSQVQTQTAQERKCAQCKQRSCMARDNAQEYHLESEIADCTLIVPFELIQARRYY